ncbi:serine hydrolase domain-containing protein [Thermodesulfobacteriota bacterium]
MMRQAVNDGVFPGGVLLVSAADAVVFFEAYGYADTFARRKMKRDTVFDLASLTKPLATTLAVMQLISQGKLELDNDLESILPAFKNTDKSRITVRHLLRHDSGLPDYRPYYETLRELPPTRRKVALRDLLLKEPLINPFGKQTLYSDLGYMILRWVVEQISGKRLDYFVAEEIYGPLGLENLFFVDSDAAPREAEFAATEKCPWRRILLDGNVHDDNAYVVGGVEGHAGLFGTADAIYRLLMVLLSDFQDRDKPRIFKKELLKEFMQQQEGKERALGFDTPALTDSSCGRYFSRHTIGHLGFTGTSFWMDLERSVLVILLTNRVHPSRENNLIKEFRPKLHDAIMSGLKIRPQQNIL